MRHDELPAFEKISKRKHHHISLPTVTKFPTCSGKMSFTKARARRVIKALTEKHGVQKELRAYRCPKNSRHWHLTSMSRARFLRYVANGTIEREG